jgi:hypothetical protein
MNMAKLKQGKRLTGPNRFPDPNGGSEAAAQTVAAATAAAAAVVAVQSAGCRFLGHDFAEGETICYRNEVWVCSLGQWARTGVDC